MKKKLYMKPAMQVVELQHKTQLLAASNKLRGTDITGLDDDDDLDIDDEEVSTGFWGR